MVAVVVVVLQDELLGCNLQCHPWRCSTEAQGCPQIILVALHRRSRQQEPKMRRCRILVTGDFPWVRGSQRLKVRLVDFMANAVLEIGSARNTCPCPLIF